MSAPMKPQIQHAYTFPPFPKAPEGVTITPYTEFKEYGIQAYASVDGGEVDGIGIPTIELSKKHDTDEGKTEARPRKSRVAIQPEVVVNPDGTKGKKYPEWYNAWQETEDSRRGNYNDMENRTDRIYSATRDFLKGRPWPPIASGVRAQFDQIQLFIGTIASTPIWQKINKEKQDDMDDGDDIDDEDDEFPSKPTNLRVQNQEDEHSRPRNSFKRLRPRPPYSTYGKTPVPVETDEEIRELLVEARNEKEDKLIEFLNDPARGVQIYLSSYMKKQGLHFSQHNLTILPRLWRFYINYLLRNRVLPEPEHETGLRRALQYVELAAEELPRTLEMAKTLPDGLCDAFQECFELKTQEHKLLAEEINGMQDDNVDIASEQPEEPKQFDLEMKNDDIETAEAMEAAFNESLESGNIRFVSSDVGLGSVPASSGATVTEVIDEDVDSVKAEDATSANSTQATSATLAQNDSGSGGWGSVQDSDNSWGNGWDTADNAGTDAQDNPWLNWSMPAPDTLMKWLGPTLFPLTHTSGILEWSVRRIKSVTPPPPASNSRKCPVLTDDEEPDGEAVEAELETHFSKVVMSPWLDWDKPDEGEPDHHLPCIHKFSRGKVVVTEGAVLFEGRNTEDVVSVEDVEKVEAEQREKGGLKPHDPLKDEITIFLERQSAEKLKVGMGIGGLWVQIARKVDLELNGVEKKTSSKEPYWFLERTHSTLTSYHVV
ncbi:hypothetical protein D9758_004234 [Tetrapyrgos nigripes]|uniref:Uncharacterized protein n=1 Tax=Tetrapyrgos nigripes TaxID=182062 RepID=A0A8H5GU31_9AGAR|nr:hypothetical protein D9758_004234 [Tetrapyrgos nigripes]